MRNINQSVFTVLVRISYRKTEMQPSLHQPSCSMAHGDLLHCIRPPWLGSRPPALKLWDMETPLWLWWCGGGAADPSPATATAAIVAPPCHRPLPSGRGRAGRGTKATHGLKVLKKSQRTEGRRQRWGTLLLCLPRLWFVK